MSEHEQPTVVLRASTESDADALAAIYGQEVTEGFGTFETDAPDPSEMRRRRDTVIEAGWPHLVATVDGQVAGFAYAGSFRPRPAYRYTVENSVYVADWARRQGIARKLLEAVIDAAGAHGARQMVAMISDITGGSEALHLACGFHYVGTLTAAGRKFDRWVDVVVMQRALGTGADTAPDA